MTAPRSPGVYLFRLPATGEIVCVGMAGPRTGSGKAQDLRGRLSIYGGERGAVTGFGEAALDRALGHAEWLEGQLASLRTDAPKRAKVWWEVPDFSGDVEEVAWVGSQLDAAFRLYGSRRGRREVARNAGSPRRGRTRLRRRVAHASPYGA